MRARIAIGYFLCIYQLQAPPPTWGTWGFVKPDLYYSSHMGIAFLANPLQYPMFSPTHHPGDLLLLIETLYVAVWL